MELIFISRRKFFRRRSSNSLRHRQARLPRSVVGREGVLHLLHVALAKVQGQARAGHNLALVQRHFSGNGGHEDRARVLPHHGVKILKQPSRRALGLFFHQVENMPPFI